MSFLSLLRGVMNVVLQLRNSGSGTRLYGSRAARDWGGSDPTATVTHGASKGGVAPASSEFGRVLPGFLFKEDLCCFLQVHVTSKVKRIKAMGEASG